MKKQVLYLAAMMCMMHAVSTFADDRVITFEQIPAAAKAFVFNSFPGHTISHATIDTDFGKTTYEVYLDNGTELEFDNNGTIEKVDCGFNAVPSSIVPEAIANYVRTHYPGTQVTKIDKKSYGYKVELSNNLELKFNHQGTMIAVGH